MPVAAAGHGGGGVANSRRARGRYARHYLLRAIESRWVSQPLACA
eukprot:COSAG01_NODE_43135_length_432_cov_59.912913_2_plen_44_part_01